MKKNKEIHIRLYQPADLSSVIEVYLSAIREIAIKDYNPSQINAWAQADYDTWSSKCSNRPTWIAKIGQKIVGFSDLEANGHIDRMYVHSAYQNIGVASALLCIIEKTAYEQRLSRIFTESSITARPFFEHRGFQAINSQIAVFNKQEFINIQMEKSLNQ